MQSAKIAEHALRATAANAYTEERFLRGPHGSKKFFSTFDKNRKSKKERVGSGEVFSMGGGVDGGWWVVGGAG